MSSAKEDDGPDESMAARSTTRESGLNKTRQRCLGMRDRALERSPAVKKMLDALKDLGCDPGPFSEFIECRSMASLAQAFDKDAAVSGGFSTNDHTKEIPKILMVEDSINDQTTFDATLVHELVHAYDQCRANVKWTNAYHIACSEVRASNLSGECGFFHELNRGKVGFVNHHQTCVKRRAALSVAVASGLSHTEAQATVAAVYQPCYKDIAPFDELYQRQRP